MKKTALIVIAAVLAASAVINFTACSSPTLPATPTQTPTITMTPTITPTSTSMAFQGAADNRIFNGALSGVNMGICSNLEIGYVSVYAARILLDFDISALPVTATVTGAVLTLACSAASGSLDVTAYKLNKNWTEGTGGCGGPAGTDSSWDNANGSADPWTNPGGDYNISTASSVAVISGAGNYNLTLNTAMVQAWVANPAQNYGMLLKAANETCCDAQIADKSTGASAPKLTVYYY